MFIEGFKKALVIYGKQKKTDKISLFLLAAFHIHRGSSCCPKEVFVDIKGD